MPLHTTQPGQKTMIFIHPKNGKFTFKVDEEETEVSSIEGTFDMVKIEADPGSPRHKILPYDAFIMHISDDENIYRIKMPIERNFSISVGQVLADLNKGDRVIATAKAGNDSTITFCNFQKQDANGNWTRPVREEFPSDKALKVARLREIVENHPAKGRDRV